MVGRSLTAAGMGRPSEVQQKERSTPEDRERAGGKLDKHRSSACQTLFRGGGRFKLTNKAHWGHMINRRTFPYTDVYGMENTAPYTGLSIYGSQGNKHCMVRYVTIFSIP